MQKEKAPTAYKASPRGESQRQNDKNKSIGSRKDLEPNPFEDEEAFRAEDAQMPGEGFMQSNGNLGGEEYGDGFDNEFADRFDGEEGEQAYGEEGEDRKDSAYMRSFDGDHYADGDHATMPPAERHVDFASEHESIEQDEETPVESEEMVPGSSGKNSSASVNTTDLQESAADFENFLELEINKAKKDIRKIGQKVELEFI